MRSSVLSKFIWLAFAVAGAWAFGSIATHRGESISAICFIVAAVCIYLVAFRFYSAWIAAKVLTWTRRAPHRPSASTTAATSCPPTSGVFGHHFAAIAGPGPLIGPTLAMQFGYLPGTLWILVGAVLGGCVQDMVIMF